MRRETISTRYGFLRAPALGWAFAGLLALAFGPLAISARAAGTPKVESVAPPAHLSMDAELDSGLFLLYDLKFTDARGHFVQWQQQHPSAPLGPALEAAADMFQEFYEAGILTSEFFRDDKQ